MSSTEQNKAVCMRLATEVLQQHDLDVLPELVHEDYVEEVPLPGQPGGRPVIIGSLHDIRADTPCGRARIR